MLQLPSAITFKDRLVEFIKQLEAHASWATETYFIVDFLCDTAHKLLEQRDLEYIKSQLLVIDTPERRKDLGPLLQALGELSSVKSKTKLRQVLNDDVLRSLSDSQYFALNVITSKWALLHGNNELDCQDLSEGTYIAKYWCPLVDSIFSSPEQTMLWLVLLSNFLNSANLSNFRGEYYSELSKKRQNRGRSLGYENRQRPRRKVDSCLRGRQDHYSIKFLIAEALKHLSTTGMKHKIDLDHLKLARTMKDTLIQLHKKAGRKLPYIRSLTVIGILLNGDTANIMCMTSVGRYVGVFHDHKTVQLPKTWTTFYRLLRIIEHLVLLNKVISHNKEQISKARDDTKAVALPSLPDTLRTLPKLKCSKKHAREQLPLAGPAVKRQQHRKSKKTTP
ncbi:MAG: hypothetical protein Q9162_007878 [Coniocarpon cinnabarinum]